jgi:multiple sugar transport system permease protein
MNDSEHKLASRQRTARRATEVGRVLLIYGLLIGGSIVFVMPFLWMIGTSFKVDREMFSEKISIFPMRPIPSVVSPYLDGRYFRVADAERYARCREPLARALRARELPLPDYAFGRENAVDVLLPGVFRKIAGRMPGALWEADDETLGREVAARLTDDTIADAARQVLRRLTLGSVRVRSLDLQERDVTVGIPQSQFWELDSAADVRLADIDAAGVSQADLVYDFSGGGESIRLSRTIDLPFKAERLYRIQVSLRPDDSWHGVRFCVEKNGRRYEGMRPEYLGNFFWSVVTLQEQGPDDASDSSKIRLWIPYREVDAGPQYDHGENRVRLTMTLRRSSAPSAWWAKCKRNYRGALDYVPFWRYAATSVFLVVLNIVGNIFACSLVAYSFARLQWPGRNVCFGLMLATLMIPPQVTMIPYFLIIRHLGWYNTLRPLWVISFFGNAFNIFLLRQFMKGIPRDLEDAARIDGCNFLQIYWYVIMPLIKPTLACIAIFTFMAVWNDFMGPLIYLNDQRLYPLSLGLYAFNVQAGGNYGMMMAGALMMTLPVIVIFFFAQKYFIQGVTLTGMKG